MELVRDGIKIEWEDIGEGLHGDFNDEDPNDIPLFRFYVLVKGEDGEWHEAEDASYCTQMPVATPEDVLRKGLEHIYDQVHDALKSGDSIKKICEDLSWIGPHTFEEGKC
jgi:hypothetical protein